MMTKNSDSACVFSKPSKTPMFLRNLQGRGGVFDKALLCSAERAYMDVCTGLARSMDCAVRCIYGVFEKMQGGVAARPKNYHQVEPCNPCPIPLIDASNV